MSETIDLQDALFILGIGNIKTVKDLDLTSIRRKAQKRWHPDRIMGHNPSKDELDRYTRNFRNVESALNIIRAYTNGTYKANRTSSDARSKKHRPKEPPRPSVSDMQERIKKAWSKVEAAHYKKSTVTNVDKEGFSVKTLIMRDLRRNFPIKTLTNFIDGYVTINLLHIAILLFISKEWRIDFAPMAVLIPYTCVFLLAILPLSRYWLPKDINTIVENIEKSLFFINTFWWHAPARFFWALASVIAWTIYILILYPLYLTVALLLHNKIIGRVEKQEYVYAGFTRAYISYLISATPQHLNQKHLSDLRRAYQEFEQFIT